MHTLIKQAIRKSAWAPIVVFIAHVFISRVLHGYARWPNIDIPMHLLGGIVIAFFFSRVLSSVEADLFQPKYRLVLHGILIFLAVATTTIFWEFAEFIRDQLFQGHAQGSIQDTMGDMLCGMLGGLGYLAAWWYGQGKS